MISPKSIEYTTVHKDLSRYCSQVIIETLDNDEVIAVFAEDRGREHRDDGRHSVIKSRDGGRTWDPATKTIVWDYTDHTGNVDAGVTQLSDGSLIISLQSMGCLKKGINWTADQYEGPGIHLTLKNTLGVWVLKSTDNGETWGERIPVNIKPMKAGATRVGITETPEGNLMLPLYGTLTSAPSSGSAERERSFIVRSDDGGENWEYYSTVAFDAAGIASYVEPAILRLSDGKWIAMLRTHLQPGRPDNIYFTVSEDDAATWSLPRRLNIWGYPADLMNLQDGRVLMVYGHRRGSYGVRGCVSEDGVTWDVKDEFVIHEGGRGPTDSVAYYHTGYPSLTQLADGTVITAYHCYSDDEPPVQYIECAHFQL